MPPTSRFTVSDLLAEARSHLQRVSPQQAHALALRGGLILDTRQDVDRWANGVIVGSLHAPRTVLEWVVDPSSGYQNPAIESFDQTLIVMCNEGYSSSLAAYTLQRLGFRNATDMIGGFAAWREAAQPIQTIHHSRRPDPEGLGPPETLSNIQCQPTKGHQ